MDKIIQTEGGQTPNRQEKRLDSSFIPFNWRIRNSGFHIRGKSSRGKYAANMNNTTVYCNSQNVGEAIRLSRTQHRPVTALRDSKEMAMNLYKLLNAEESIAKACNEYKNRNKRTKSELNQGTGSSVIGEKEEGKRLMNSTILRDEFKLTTVKPLLLLSRTLAMKRPAEKFRPRISTAFLSRKTGRKNAPKLSSTFDPKGQKTMTNFSEDFAPSSLELRLYKDQKVGPKALRSSPYFTIKEPERPQGIVLNLKLPSEITPTNLLLKGKSAPVHLGRKKRIKVRFRNVLINQSMNTMYE